jgi:hypothetical protein
MFPKRGKVQILGKGSMKLKGKKTKLDTEVEEALLTSGRNLESSVAFKFF